MLVKKRKKIVSRTKALSLMRRSKGLFTAMFVKKDKSCRVIHATLFPKQDKSKLGYVTVEDAILKVSQPEDCIRVINMQTIYELIVNGVHYKIN